MSLEHDARRYPRVERADSPIQDPRLALRSEGAAPVRFDWRKNVALFLLTVISVFYVGQLWSFDSSASGLHAWLSAWKFAVPLLTILLCHEFGHYFAARLHRVPSSLPYFLPCPILNPFGTLGAIIIMPERIRTRRALLDIGAAGPLAGMVAAIPLMMYGLAQSEIAPRATEGYMQEGQSLLYLALKYLTFGPIPASHDVVLHPTALAAWAGFLVTFLNLIPFGQLDGGHIAYALLGERQNRLARLIFFAPVFLIGYNIVVFAVPVLRRGFIEGFASIPTQAWVPVASSLGNWVLPLVLLGVMRRTAGLAHPAVDDRELSLGRKCVGAFTLLLFVLLFMPSPMVAF